MLKEYIGKEIQLYPADTYKKWGILLDYSPVGILVKITRCISHSEYRKGDVAFFAYSARLHFKFVQ